MVDNYSVEVLPKLGLGYDVLSKLNPKLVMMSMSAFGAGSVNRDCRAYGSTLEQGSGLPSVVGRCRWPAGHEPHRVWRCGRRLEWLCAPCSPALIHARLTGKGQFIDLAQIECMMPFAAPWIIAHSIDGKAPVKYGNRHPDFVPHGCFPCAGERQLDRGRGLRRCDVAEAGDDCSAAPTGPPIAQLKTAAGRRAIESEIEAAITAWTCSARSGRGDERAAGGGRRLGRGAAADRTVEAIRNCRRAASSRKSTAPSSARIRSRRCRFAQAESRFRSEARRRRSASITAKFSAALLGLSDAEIDQLTRDGIIGTEMLMEEQLVKERSGRRADGSGAAGAACMARRTRRRARRR